jgi:hypothetical protein
MANAGMTGLTMNPHRTRQRHDRRRSARRHRSLIPCYVESIVRYVRSSHGDLFERPLRQDLTDTGNGRWWRSGKHRNYRPRVWTEHPEFIVVGDVW